MSIFSNLFRFNKSRSISDVIYWQNATYAILTTLNNDNVKLVGGCNKTRKKIEMKTRGLIEWWSINNRMELIDMVEKLKNGLHNKDFLENIEGLNIPNYRLKQEFILNELVNYKEEAHPLFITMYDIWQKNKKYGNEPIIGWDLCRAVYLCHTGYLIGYLSYDEALDMALDICIRLQAKFQSWDELFFNYLDGYQYWSEEFICNPLSEANERIRVYNNLKNEKDSPFQLDWNLPLKRDW